MITSGGSTMLVMTVRGPIDPDKLGVTQTHEHLLCNMYWKTGTVDDLLNDESLATDEIINFRTAGGTALVDPTNKGLGRDPAALKRISESTGVHVIMGSGWYRAPFYPDEIDRRSTNDLASEIISDLTHGVDGTGIKAGIIGEIGVNLDYLTAGEERVLRAAARAHKRTGVAITLHAEYCPVGLQQLDILEEEGVNLSRVIVGHADSYLRLDYHEAIARRGAYVEYDGVGRPHIYPDQSRVRALTQLVQLGHIDKVLLSTDRCRRSDLRLYGGEGYDHLLVNFIPMLKDAGISDEQIRMMLVENPKRILAY
jgi:predicted metal-dependent phosphotriesterase family hydrolase